MVSRISQKRGGGVDRFDKVQREVLEVEQVERLGGGGQIFPKIKTGVKKHFILTWVSSVGWVPPGGAGGAVYLSGT